jgi:ABC-type phosphate transport system auxiliary subunit
LGIEDITKQIRSQVTTHHLKLLTKASSVASLDRPLQSVKNALQQLEANLERLNKKIGNRHATLEDALGRLDRYQAAADLSRKTSRFVTLAKRLEAQMAELDLNPLNQRDNIQDTSPKSPSGSTSKDQHEIVLAESALTLSELEKLLDSELETASVEATSPTEANPQTVCSIRSLTAIQPHVQAIVSARKKVEEQMTRILNQGLVQLDRSMLSSSFQTAYNLSILDRSVGSMIFELTELINKRIKLAFDLNSLAREAGANGLFYQPLIHFFYLFFWRDASYSHSQSLSLQQIPNQHPVLGTNHAQELSPHLPLYHIGRVHYGVD